MNIPDITTIRKASQEMVTELSTKFLHKYLKANNANRAKQLETKHTSDDLVDIANADETLEKRRKGVTRVADKLSKKQD